MRALLLLAVLGFTQSCTNAAVTGGSLDIRTIAADASGAATEKSAQFARDAETYRRLWDTLAGSGQAPAVDFTTESAVFVMAGQKRSGGYSVVVNGVSLDGKTLVIHATVQSPPPNAIVSLALTSPYAVVAVKNRTFDSVFWMP
jgi:hypothetical protein